MRLIRYGAPVFVALVYLITLTILPRDGFWVVDNANKFLQLQSFVDSGGASFAIAWPGRVYDPDLLGNPIPPPFSHVENGQIFSVFSPIFPLVSVPAFLLLGFRGLYLLPLVAGVLTLVGVSRLGSLLGLPPRTRSVGVLLAGICTPLWFYSVAFWEHTAAVCLCIWAVCCFTSYLRSPSDRTLLAGAALAALGVYFRDELYLFCAIVLVTAVVLARGRRLRTLWLGSVCTVASLAPLWLFQWIALGHPFGFHLATHLPSGTAFGQHLSARPVVLYNLFVASHESPWRSAFIASPFLVALLLSPRLSRRGFQMVVPLLSAVALVGGWISVGGYLGNDQPIGWLIAANSLFAASPFLILACVRVKDSERPCADPSLVRWLWILCLGYAVLYGIAAPQVGSWGIHWGNRFLLVLYPMLSLLAAVTLGQWFSWLGPRFRWAALPVVALVLLSLGAQVYSVQLLRWKKQFSVRLNQAIEGRDEAIVISDVWWVPQAMFGSFDQKSMFYTETQSRMDHIVRNVRASGHREFLFVTLAGDEPDPRAVAEVRDHEMGFFSVVFYHGEIP